VETSPFRLPYLRIQILLLLSKKQKKKNFFKKKFSKQSFSKKALKNFLSKVMSWKRFSISLSNEIRQNLRNTKKKGNYIFQKFISGSWDLQILSFRTLIFLEQYSLINLSKLEGSSLNKVILQDAEIVKKTINNWFFLTKIILTQ